MLPSWIWVTKLAIGLGAGGKVNAKRLQTIVGRNVGIDCRT